MELKVHRLPAHALHRAHAVDTLRQGAVDDRAGLPGPKERLLGPGQPDDAHDEQSGDHRKGQEAKLQIQAQQDRDDPDQQEDIADGENRGLEKFLQRVDVALEARHQAAHLGLIHERQGDPLQMQVHGTAQAVEHPLGGVAHHGQLQVIGPVVDRDQGHEGQDRQIQRPPVHRILLQGIIDHIPDHQRDRHLGQGKDHDRRQGEE
jgi:hypothetical protein